MNSASINRLIIFTDLDGTLLDHETYSCEKAKPALEQLKAHTIPLVLASSKTAAEIIPLRDALGFSHCPAIVENGAGIVGAHGGNAAKSPTHYKIIEALQTLAPELRSQFAGFSDWSAQEVSARTGLSLNNAENAKKRQFSEPGLWLGNEAEQHIFIQSLKSKGITATRGGRFLSLSFGGNKAERMIEIAHTHSKPDAPAFLVALGDAQNDVAMLNQANLGFIIPNHSHAGIPRLEGEASGHIIRANHEGPKGWNEVILSLLADAHKTRN